jgi:hypothetical protein
MSECEHVVSGITRLKNGHLISELVCDHCGETLASLPGEPYKPDPNVISQRYRWWMAQVIAKASTVSEAKASVLAPSRGGKPGSVILVGQGASIEDRVRRRFGGVKNDRQARDAIRWAQDLVLAAKRADRKKSQTESRDEFHARVIRDYVEIHYEDVAMRENVSKVLVWKIRDRAGVDHLGRPKAV